MKISLAEIATRSGVSVATVSRVLNGRTEVSPTLSAKVKSVLSEIDGFHTRIRTRRRSAMGKSMPTIGFLANYETSEFIKELFRYQLLEGTESRVSEKKGHLMFSSSLEDISRGRIPAMIEQRLVAGVILKIAYAYNHLDWVRKIAATVPTVIVMESMLDIHISSVTCDNDGSTAEAIRYLYNLGHRKIGFLAIRDFQQNPQDGSFKIDPSIHHDQRKWAFHHHMEAMGLETPKEYIQTPDRFHTKDTLEQVIQETLKGWLNLGERRPTAIICANDLYATILIKEANSLNLNVPKDLSVLGYTSTYLDKQTNPAMTSFALNGLEMGRAAVDLLEFRMKNPNSPARLISIADTFIDHGTCGKIS